MSHVPHELAAKFLELKERIHDLKISNGHFARLFDAYHIVNRDVHRAKAAGLNITNEHYDELRRKRMSLKDELYRLMSATQPCAE